MTRILTTLEHRTALPNASHGRLLEIDWDNRRINKTIEAPPLYSGFEFRDRGGRRGLRGITRLNGILYVAASDALYGFDLRSLRLERIVSDAWMGSIHEIMADGNGIWVTATSHDGVFLIDEGQNRVRASWLGSPPERDLRVHFSTENDKLHINTVFKREGEICCYANATGAVVRVWPGPVAEIARFETGCHNVVPSSHGWIRNQSLRSTVLVGERSLSLPARGSPLRYTRPGWLRGLAFLPSGNIVVGSSPARIFEIDPAKLKVIEEMELDPDVSWTVHSIHVDEERLSSVDAREPSVGSDSRKISLDSLLSNAKRLASQTVRTALNRIQHKRMHRS